MKPKEGILMKDHYYEKLLNITTTGEQKKYNESIHYNVYEPTSYEALEILFKEYFLSKNDTIIDFGCGKGRLSFYSNYFYSCNSVGIEMNPYYHKCAINNIKSFNKKHKNITNTITFINTLAEKYTINPSDNKFYFFNPFSEQIFIKVIQNILYSIEESPRTVDIILYYPSDDYIFYLENNTSFSLLCEIPIDKLYKKNRRYKFLIYRLS